MLDKTKIPALSSLIAEDYFYRLDHMHFDNAVLLSNFFISKILCFNRVLIKIKEDDLVPPNLFCLNFGSSGSGKDRSRKQIEKMIAFMYEDKNKMEEQYRKQKQCELEMTAEKEGMSKGKIINYVKDNMPRTLFSMIRSTSTAEGLASVHEALADCGFGEITWIDSEISDTMARYRAGGALDDLIVIIKEAADTGEFISKTIKGNRTLKAQGNVPYMAWLHGAIDEDNGKGNFRTFLQLGFARRSILCLADNGIEDERTIEQLEEDEKIAMKEKEFIMKSLKEIHKRVKIDTKYKYEGAKIITLDNKADKLYRQYKQDCYNRAVKLPKYTKTILRDDIGNLYFKALKLSAVFAVQSHNELVINETDLANAIYVIEYFNKHLAEFLNTRSMNDMNIWENMIISLNVKGKMSKTDFYKEPYFPKFRNSQKRTFDENIIIAREKMKEENKIISEERISKNRIEYQIIDIPEHQKEQPNIIRLSIGGSAKLTEIDFEANDINWDEIYLITGGDKVYSAGIFNGNKRAVKNWIGRNDLIILDIDNDRGEELKIDEARARFAGFTHYICTTKSHQKEKKGAITDRFRIIFPVTMCALDNQKFKDIIKNLCYQYGISDYCDIPASSDPSRMYLPYSGQEYWYNEGLIMNPLMFYYKDEEGEIKRKFPSGQTLRVSGNAIGLNEAIQEAKAKGGKTIPCHAFCHEDNNPSAFFCINRDGNFQYTCSVCGQSYFVKL